MAKKNIKKVTVKSKAAGKKRGYFITLEGLEGSGKSSVINFIKGYLERRGARVKVFREPGSTYIGEKIREILLDRRNKDLSVHTELLLYLAARTQLIEEKLQTAYLECDFIVCDRFFDSTLAYQGYALKVDITPKAVKMFSLGVMPDLTLVLDVAIEQGLGRIKVKDRIESRPLSFHTRLRQGYLKLSREYPKRIKVIDARGSLEDIYRRVEKVLADNLPQKNFKKRARNG